MVSQLRMSAVIATVRLRECLKRVGMVKTITTIPKKPTAFIRVLMVVVTTLVVHITRNRAFKASSEEAD
ncbi:hypothetical protein OsccyDRAFT_2331 [Leptolyngbyaceae cyanobacterium JSC-12]|nr:hypothetical protein OsccyDRAFT_2331 [Leptolyngbyaceae cyanobacterium JSC-12]